jgi:hypothetical protein
VMARFSDECTYAFRELAATRPELKRIQPPSEKEIMNPHADKLGIAQHWVVSVRHLGQEAMRGVIDANTRLRTRFLELRQELIARFRGKETIAEAMKEFVREVDQACRDEMTTHQQRSFVFYEAAYNNGVYRLLLPGVFERIVAIEQEEQNTVIKSRTEQIDVLLKRTEAMISAKDDEDYGKMLGRAIAKGVRRACVAADAAQAVDRLKASLPWRTPEALLRYVFSISFEQKDYLKVLKYMVNVEKLMAEEVLGLLARKKPKFYQERTASVRNRIIEEYKTVERQVGAAPRDLNSADGFVRLLGGNARLPEVVEVCRSLTHVYIHDPPKCAQGILIGLREEVALITTPGNRDEPLAPEIPNATILKVIEEYCGCSERCLICGAKCVKARDHRSDPNHKALHHLCAFSGKTYKWLQIPILEECKTVYNRLLYTAAGEVVNRAKDIRQRAPQWAEDMQNPTPITEDRTLLIAGWANSRLPFEYNLKISEFVPMEVLDLEEPLRCLDPEMPLPDYFQQARGLHKAEIPELDIAFLLDCTDSMKNEIEGSIAAIQSIVEKTRELCGVNAQIGFVGYRDHEPPPGKDKGHTQSPNNLHRIITARLTSKHDSVIRFINANKEGANGFDFAEAVADGLHAVLHLNWREHSQKLVFHIVDGPPHGREYHNAGTFQKHPDMDYYPDGCPCGLKCPELLKQLAAQRISYFMLNVRNADHLQNTVAIFRAAYPRMYYLNVEGSSLPDQTSDSPESASQIHRVSTLVAQASQRVLATHMLNFLLSSDI